MIQIVRIEGLESLTGLLVLSVEDNDIKLLDGIQVVPSLMELCEYFFFFFHCCCWCCFVVFSVSSSLVVVNTSCCLFISCRRFSDAGNNRIEAVRDLSVLKDNPRLIILELWGNPLTQDPEYRLFSIFHLKRLKVRPFSFLSIVVTKSSLLF